MYCLFTDLFSSVGVSAPTVWLAFGRGDSRDDI